MSEIQQMKNKLLEIAADLCDSIDEWNHYKMFLDISDNETIKNEFYNCDLTLDEN